MQKSNPNNPKKTQNCSVSQPFMILRAFSKSKVFCKTSNIWRGTLFKPSNTCFIEKYDKIYIYLFTKCISYGITKRGPLRNPLVGQHSYRSVLPNLTKNVEKPQLSIIQFQWKLKLFLGVIRTAPGAFVVPGPMVVDH